MTNVEKLIVSFIAFSVRMSELKLASEKKYISHEATLCKKQMDSIDQDDLEGSDRESLISFIKDTMQELGNRTRAIKDMEIELERITIELHKVQVGQL
jgi:hypothetical protein